MTRPSCNHCLMPFGSPEDLGEHLARSGHKQATSEPPLLCACGLQLLTPVSLEVRSCAACRWAHRDLLGPAALRLLARSFRTKAHENAVAGKDGAAADYCAEAEACEETAGKREAALV